MLGLLCLLLLQLHFQKFLAASISYYQILQVEKNSTAYQIKKAFNRLSLIYHPDKAKPSISQSVGYPRIVEAYQILSDPAKRQKYDRLLSLGYLEYIEVDIDAGPRSESYRGRDPRFDASYKLQFISKCFFLVFALAILLSLLVRFLRRPPKLKRDKSSGHLVQTARAPPASNKKITKQAILRKKEMIREVIQLEEQAEEVEEVERLPFINESYTAEEEEEIEKILNESLNVDSPSVTCKSFPCRTCQKTFKNLKQLDNHLSSKKHRKNALCQKEGVSYSEPSELPNTL